METRRVRTGKDLRTFLRFPWKVYAGDPNWVPPLVAEVRKKLDPGKNPFFLHGEAACFLACGADGPAGRIAAVVDRNHNERHGDRTGFFGMFECLNDPDAARALVAAAGAWCGERGMDTLRGPMNLSMNDECAFLIDGFDSPPAIMMSYNPPYYLDLMRACGMAKAKDLYAFRLESDETGKARVRAALAKIAVPGDFTFRPIAKARLLEDALKVGEVYNKGWRDNWGFVPWTPEELGHMARNLVRVADLDLVLFAEHAGRPVGFAFGLPNLNEALIRLNGRLFPFGFLKLMTGRKSIRGVRAIAFGVLPEYMHTGLAYLLYDKLAKAILAKGYTWCELSWQLEDNEAVNRFAASLGAAPYKKYRIYETKIPNGGV
jgi:GNAT superfamily N-acetyltransferase